MELVVSHIIFDTWYYTTAYQADHAIAKHVLSRLESSYFKTESIRKLSNFNFQWTKTLYQNNLNNIAFFFSYL